VFYGGSFRKSTDFLQVGNFFPLPYFLPTPNQSPCYNLLRSGAFSNSARPLPLFLVGWQTTKQDLFASRTQ
jgi:hypothetical protein